MDFPGPSTSSGGKAPRPNAFKRARFNPKQRPPGAPPNASNVRGGKPGYAKQPSPVAKANSSVSAHFPVYTSTSGIPIAVDAVIEMIASRDNQLRRLIPSCLLKYVLSLKIYARLAELALFTGSSHVEDIETLRQLTKDIALPEVLAHYVECFGTYTTPNGVPLTPLTCQNLEAYMDTRDNVPIRHRLPLNQYYFDHRELEADILQAINAFNNYFQIPELEADDAVAISAWHIVPAYIRFYISNTRLDHVRSPFRVVPNVDLAGKLEQFSLARVEANGTISPRAALTLSEAENQLGAVLRFRTDNPLSWVPARGNPAITGVFRTSPEVYNSQIHIISFAKTLVPKLNDSN